MLPVKDDKVIANPIEDYAECKFIFNANGLTTIEGWDFDTRGIEAGPAPMAFAVIDYIIRYYEKEYGISFMDRYQTKKRKIV